MSIIIVTIFMLIYSSFAVKVCKNGGVLYESKGREYCVCHKNYAGDECELNLEMLLENDRKKLGCSLKPCLFGATCEDLSHVGGTFKCHCSANTYGEYCQFTRIDGTNPCKSSPCYNEGECINQDDISYRCSCKDPYGDSNCKTNTFGICKNNPCQKESICIGNQTYYKCNCIDWTIGRNCEDVFNPCSVVTCANGGSCLRRRTLGYECKCADGFIGLKCNQRTNESCVSGRACVHGSCELNSTGLYECRCKSSGYEGEFCEIEKCDVKCVNGICKKSSDGVSYTCECAPNFKGPACAENVCFSEDMLVETRDRGTLKISQLKSNDMVKTIDLNSLAFKFTRFITYLHSDSQMIAKYLRIETNSSTLSVSPLHLIAKKDTQTNKIDFVHAESIQINDFLFDSIKSQFSQVKHIKLIHGKGAYAPLTEDGTLIVNGVLASCYAQVKNQRIAHLSMQPLIIASKFVSLKTSENTVHWYANTLDTLVGYLPLKISQYIV